MINWNDKIERALQNLDRADNFVNQKQDRVYLARTARSEKKAREELAKAIEVRDEFRAMVTCLRTAQAANSYDKYIDGIVAYRKTLKASLDPS